MIAELIIDRIGWNHVWYPRASPPYNRDPCSRWWHVIIRPTDSCFVGVWTGPQRDLLCVKECETNDEANRWLAPGGRTLLDATLRSLVVYVRGPMPHAENEVREPR